MNDMFDLLWDDRSRPSSRFWIPPVPVEESWKKSHGQNKIQRSRVLIDDKYKKLRNGTVLFFPRAWFWRVKIYSDETITVTCLRLASILCLVVLSPIFDVQLRSSKSIIFCRIFFLFLLYIFILFFVTMVSLIIRWIILIFWSL